MGISDEILLKKYGHEINLIKDTILGKAKYDISDQKFLDILKVVLNNGTLSIEDLRSVSKNLGIDSGILDYVHKEFYKRENNLNVLNFEFPKYVIMPIHFKNDGEKLDFLFEAIRSQDENVKVVETLQITDLIAMEHLNLLNSFLIDYIFCNKVKKNVEFLVEEIRDKNRYRRAKLKINDADKHLLDALGREFKALELETEYYVRIIYPYITLHEINTLREILTIKLEKVNIQFLE